MRRVTLKTVQGLDSRSRDWAAQPENKSLLEDLYRQYSPSLRRHTFRILGPGGNIDDVVQEAFARTIKTLAEGKGIRSIPAWLYTCAHNCAIDALKESKRRPFEIDEARDSSTEHDLHEPAKQRNNSRIVINALTELSQNQRSVFLLNEVQGLSTRQIATMLGTTPGSIRVVLFKAKKKIRNSAGVKQGTFAGLILRTYLETGDEDTKPRLVYQLKQQLTFRYFELANWAQVIQGKFDAPIAAVAGVAAVSVMAVGISLNSSGGGGSNLSSKGASLVTATGNSASPGKGFLRVVTAIPDSLDASRPDSTSPSSGDGVSAKKPGGHKGGGGSNGPAVNPPGEAAEGPSPGPSPSPSNPCAGGSTSTTTGEGTVSPSGSPDLDPSAQPAGGDPQLSGEAHTSGSCDQYDEGTVSDPTVSEGGSSSSSGSSNPSAEPSGSGPGPMPSDPEAGPSPEPVPVFP